MSIYYCEDINATIGICQIRLLTNFLCAASVLITGDSIYVNLICDASDDVGPITNNSEEVYRELFNDWKIYITILRHNKASKKKTQQSLKKKKKKTVQMPRLRKAIVCFPHIQEQGKRVQCLSILVSHHIGTLNTLWVPSHAVIGTSTFDVRKRFVRNP